VAISVSPLSEYGNWSKAPGSCDEELGWGNVFVPSFSRIRENFIDALFTNKRL
jgi:hypothetical protein